MKVSEPYENDGAEVYLITPDENEVFSYSESAAIYDPISQQITYSAGGESGKGVIRVVRTPLGE